MEVNNLISYATRYQQDNHQLMLTQNQLLFQELSAQSSWFVFYVLMALLILIWVTIKTTRDIGRPLTQLTANADRFAQGETPQLNGLERADEIGKLSRSLDYMMRQIQHKEEALMAENERYLEKKNRFVLALTSTWDKGSFCRALFRTP